MSPSRRAWLALLFGLALSGHGHAGSPPDDEKRFSAAFALEAAGRPAEAAAALEAFAGDRPDSTLAPDALAEAATLYEDPLFDSVAALRCWTLVVERYPRSAQAERARARKAVLSEALRGVDPALVGTLERLITTAGATPDAAARATVERFIAEHTDPRLVGRAAYWLAHAADLRDDEREARARYEQAIASGPPWAARAARDRAELLLRKRRLGEAATAFDSLAAYDDPVSQIARTHGLAELSSARRLRALAIASWVVMALFAIVHLVLGRRELWPAPIGVRYLFPVAALFAIAAATEHRAIAIAVATIAAGALAIAWLSGAVARRPFGIAARIGLALFAAVAALSLSFVAIRANDLVALVAETMKAGPER